MAGVEAKGQRTEVDAGLPLLVQSGHAIGCPRTLPLWFADEPLIVKNRHLQVLRATGQPPREQHLGLMGSMASERIAQFFMRSPGVAVSVNDSAAGVLGEASRPVARNRPMPARALETEQTFGVWFT